MTLTEYGSAVLDYLSKTDIDSLFSMVETIAGPDKADELRSVTMDLIETAYNLNNIPPSMAASTIYLAAITAYDDVFGIMNKNETRH